MSCVGRCAATRGRPWAFVAVVTRLVTQLLMQRVRRAELSLLALDREDTGCELAHEGHGMTPEQRARSIIDHCYRMPGLVPGWTLLQATTWTTARSISN